MAVEVWREAWAGAMAATVATEARVVGLVREVAMAAATAVAGWEVGAAVDAGEEETVEVVRVEVVMAAALVVATVEEVTVEAATAGVAREEATVAVAKEEVATEEAEEEE